MNYIQTSDMRIISLDVPEPDSLVLNDLAFALAHINRFTGHAGVYSVAQHSIHVANILKDRGYPAGVQAGGLMHDAHEAITGDMSTPMKQALKAAGFDFRAFEAPFIDAVESRFRVNTRRSSIKRVDAQICNTEADTFLGGRTGPGWPDVEPADIILPRWTPTEAYAEFLVMAIRLDVY